MDPAPPIRVNRAPVLTLWATVVAERLGYPPETALCQSALNIDPPSASKIDPPFVVACAGSP